MMDILKSGFVVLLASLIILSGCVSNNTDTVDESQVYGNDTDGTPDTLEDDETINYDVDSVDVESQESGLNDGELIYCRANLGEVEQEYYFSKDLAVMKTMVPPNSWNKVRIDRELSCSWENMSGLHAQCVPVTDAGGFDSVVNSWRENAEAIGSCENIEYDGTHFEMPST